MTNYCANMDNTSSSYDLTLTNNHTFYMAATAGDYDLVLLLATRLYYAHHSKEGLTIPDRLATIAAAVNYLTNG